MSFSWFKETENWLAVCLALFVLGLHLLVISNPDQMILDEQHYVPEANFIIAGEEPDNPEHPSLGKMIIVTSITLFGDNPFGWRLFPILFGTASIILFYLICKKLTAKKYVPIIATFIFAFENLQFVMASVAMLDIFSFTFMLASFLLYLHNRHIYSGIALALSALAKLTGAFGAAVILLYWFFTGRNRNRDGLRFAISAPLAFLVLMPLFDWLAMGEFLWPWDRIHFMISTHSTLVFATSTASQASHPWDWIISLTPMWFWYKPSYRAGISWTLWVLIIPTVGYSIYQSIKGNALCMFALIWFTCTYLIWIPIELVTDRVMFYFYFYPAVGAVCMALGFAVQRLWLLATEMQTRKVRWAIRSPILLFGVAHVVVFLIMSPLL